MFLFRLAMHSSKQVDVAQNISNMEDQLYKMHYGENYKNPDQLRSFASNLTNFYRALTPQNPDYAQGMAFCSAAFNWLKGAAQYSGVDLELPDQSKLVSSMPKNADSESFKSHYSNFLTVCSQFAGSRRSREGIDMLTRTLDEISQDGETARKRVLILDDSGKADEFISALQSIRGVEFSITTESGERYNKGPQKVAVVFSGTKTSSEPLEAQTEFMVPREKDLGLDTTGSQTQTKYTETQTTEPTGIRKTKELVQSVVADLYLAYRNVATNDASLEEVGNTVDMAFRELAGKMGFKGKDAIGEFLASPQGKTFHDELERRIGNGTFRIVSSASTEYIGNVADYEKQIQNAIDRGQMASEFINARLVDAGLSRLEIPILPSISLLQEIPEGERQRLINSSSTSEGLKDFLQNRYSDQDVRDQRQAVFGYIHQAAQEGDQNAIAAWDMLTKGSKPPLIVTTLENGETQYDIGRLYDINKKNPGLNTLLSLKRGVLRTKGSILEEALSERNSRSVKFEIAYSISDIVPDLKPVALPPVKPIAPQLVPKIKITPPAQDILYRPRLNTPLAVPITIGDGSAIIPSAQWTIYAGEGGSVGNLLIDGISEASQLFSQGGDGGSILKQKIFNEDNLSDPNTAYGKILATRGNPNGLYAAWASAIPGGDVEEYFRRLANWDFAGANQMVSQNSPLGAVGLSQTILGIQDTQQFLGFLKYTLNTKSVEGKINVLDAKDGVLNIYLSYSEKTGKFSYKSVPISEVKTRVGNVTGMYFSVPLQAYLAFGVSKGDITTELLNKKLSSGDLTGFNVSLGTQNKFIGLLVNPELSAQHWMLKTEGKKDAATTFGASAFVTTQEYLNNVWRPYARVGVNFDKKTLARHQLETDLGLGLKIKPFGNTNSFMKNSELDLSVGEEITNLNQPLYKFKVGVTIPLGSIFEIGASDERKTKPK